MQFGILPFLRRSRKTFPPLAAPTGAAPAQPLAAPDIAPSCPPSAPPALSGDVATFSGTAPEDAMAPAPLAAPAPFHSGHYGYALTLPPGWQSEGPHTIAGSPTVDRLHGPDDLRVGVWNEPCPWRTLPAVAASDRVGIVSLGNSRLVSLVAFAPNSSTGRQFWEGRWLAAGRRWTVSVQLPSSGDGAAALALLRPVLASFQVDG